MMILIRVLPMSLTKLDELHESGDGDTHQVPRLCTKSSCQDRTGNPWRKEIDIRLTRNDHFWPAAAPTPRPNPWTPKSKREPSSESFRENTFLIYSGGLVALPGPGWLGSAVKAQGPGQGPGPQARASGQGPKPGRVPPLPNPHA